MKVLIASADFQDKLHFSVMQPPVLFRTTHLRYFHMVSLQVVFTCVSIICTILVLKTAKVSCTDWYTLTMYSVSLLERLFFYSKTRILNQRQFSYHRAAKQKKLLTSQTCTKNECTLAGSLFHNA